MKYHQMKQSKTNDLPKNIFSQNKMKIYFLSNPQNVKHPSQPLMSKYSLGAIFLIVLQPLFYSHESKDFREIYENRPKYASRHGSRQ